VERKSVFPHFPCLDLDGAMVDPCEFQVDVAILEVGLGGRFDSTNVVSILYKALNWWRRITKNDDYYIANFNL
jgi:hypothetical protein